MKSDPENEKIPTMSLLQMYAPQSVWESAQAQAERSPLTGFRTGAVIWNERTGDLLSRGCSHSSEKRIGTDNCHAEFHALSNWYGMGNKDTVCVIVTMNRHLDGWAWSSRPCAFCAHALHSRGVEHVMFAERDNTGVWTVTRERMSDLMERVARVPVAGFSKRMRVPPPTTTSWSPR